MPIPAQDDLTVTIDGNAYAPHEAFGTELTVFHFRGDDCHFITSSADIPRQLRFPSNAVTIRSTDETRSLTINLPDSVPHDTIIVAGTPEQVETPCRCRCERQQLGLPVLATMAFSYGDVTRHLTFPKEDAVRCVRLLTLIRSAYDWHLEEDSRSSPELLELAMQQFSIDLLR